MTIWLEHGDMRTVLQRLYAEDAQVDAIVTDPPYELGFMGKKWDNTGIATQVNTWRLCWDLLPPGGHLLAFSGTRTYHRMAVAIEEAGFEIRDTIGWLYGSGFPKSHNVSKGIDRAAGAEREVVGFDETKYRANRDKHLLSGQPGGGGKLKSDNGATITAPTTEAARQWEGWGTALKPAMELICLARKPLSGTVAANVLKHGVGALNIDGCRIRTSDKITTIQGQSRAQQSGEMYSGKDQRDQKEYTMPDAGRWPANVVHDGSEEVVRGFPDQKSGGTPPMSGGTRDVYGKYDDIANPDGIGATSGNASRFFYCTKANAKERMGFDHPTVKPIALLRWLVRMVTPPGGVVLDPFAGTGTMGAAAEAEGFDAILVEREAKYAGFIKERLPAAQVTVHDVQP